MNYFLQLKFLVKSFFIDDNSVMLYKTSIKHPPLTNCKTSIFLRIRILFKMSYSHQIIIGKIFQGNMEASNVIL